MISTRSGRGETKSFTLDRLVASLLAMTISSLPLSRRRPRIAGLTVGEISQPGAFLPMAWIEEFKSGSIFKS
jgi:hypothetical protein